MQAKFDKVLAKGSHDLKNQALARVASHPALVQIAQPDPVKAPVQSGQADDFGDIKCGPIPDCGLLYDTLSLQWGMYKDRVDELKSEMDDNLATWLALKQDFDSQISSLSDALDACTRQLSD